jgi:hypothetical protein
MKLVIVFTRAVEIALTRNLWTRGDFDLAGWFYILSDLHGSNPPLDELLHLRCAEKRSKVQKATVELERARALIVCSNYQQAEWHYLLAEFYGSVAAKAEVASMRDLIYYLEGE